MADYEKGDVSTHEYTDSNGYADEKGRRSSRLGSITGTGGRRTSVIDDVFGEIKEGGVNYRDVSTSSLH